jgi:hypothetical protein
MKATLKLFGATLRVAIIALFAVIGLYLASCDSGGGKDESIPVIFLSVSANGSASQTSTQLTLNFSTAIDGLSASDITLSGLSGLSKGTLSGNRTYSLPISGVSETGTLTVAVSKAGYTISDSPKTTTVYLREGSPIPGSDGDFDYQEYSKWIVISKYNGQASSVNIPNQIAGKPVTSIGVDSFYYCTTLTSVTIPNGITSIEMGAFYSCDRLTSVTIPDSVTSIGASAFSKCVALASVTIGNGVTTIGAYAFNECTSLTRITIPSSVTSIAMGAFWSCTDLDSVKIENSVTSIGMSAFENCKLSNLDLGNGVTSIGGYTFSVCTGLTSVIIPASVYEIGVRAFSSDNLTSVTFQGTINSSRLNSTAFDGDLKNKYLAGGKGTYKRTGDTIVSDPIWTKQ